MHITTLFTAKIWCSYHITENVDRKLEFMLLHKVYLLLWNFQLWSGFVFNLEVSPTFKKITFQMISISNLLETPSEFKINLSCTSSCTALNCTVVQRWTLHGSSILYCSKQYCKIQFCNALYCIIIYWSLMQSMVLSVLLQNGVVICMCNALQSEQGMSNFGY